MARIQEQYPNAKTLIAAWDFYIRLQPEEVQEIIRMFDPETTLILDYTADLKYEKSCIEKWNVVGKFPWIFGLFHAYMPQSHVHGDYEFIAEKFAQADQDSFCKGMDFWPETSHSDTLMLTYFAENAWRPTGRSIEEVAQDLCRKRYGLAAEAMWGIWRKALPLLRLPDIDYTSCVYNLLQNMVLKQVLDQNHPHHAERVAMWRERVASQLPMDAAIADLVKAVRELPQEWMNDPFIHRDCVDLVRSVLTQMLHIHYIHGALLFDAWRTGDGSAQTVREEWKFCRHLLDSLAQVLNTHEDYSMYRTLLEQGKEKAVNPYFEEALKENLLNRYCRTAAYELVKSVYTQEADVLESWIFQCVKEGTASEFPKEEFVRQQQNIEAQFMEKTLNQHYGAGMQSVGSAMDAVLRVMRNFGIQEKEER